MASPVVASSTTFEDATGSVTSRSINKPSGTASGDWLICVVAMDGAGGVAISGFTEVFSREIVGVDNVSIYVLKRKADGSEGASFTVSSNSEGGSGCMMRITGGDSTDVIEALASAGGRKDGSSMPCLPVYSATADTLVLHCVAEDGADTTVTDPAGTNVCNLHNGVTTSAGLSIVRNDKASTGYTDAVRFTSDDALEEWASVTLVLRSNATESFPSQPVIRGAHYYNPNTTSALTYPKPYGTVDGDLLLLIQTSDVASTLTPPGTFTSVQDTNNGTAVYHQVYRRIASSEGSSYTGSNSTSAAKHGLLLLVKNADTTTPINQSSSATGTDAAPTAPTITPGVNNCLLLWTAGADDDDRTYGGGTATGYTHFLNIATTEGNDSTQMVAYATQTTASATGSVAGALTASEEWVAFNLAIAPAAAGTTGTFSATEAADTVTASGSEIITGSASPTEAADTVTGSGSLVITGTASPTEANDTASGRESLVPTEITDAIADLKIDAGTSARFADLYRYLPAGKIHAYFMLSAFTLAPQVFTASERRAAIAQAIDKLVVAPRENSATYAQYAHAVFPSGKIYFVNIAGGATAGSAPSEAGVSNAGDFLGDGSITWEYTGVTVPTTWQWFLVDIDGNLLTPVHPDSTDAYAGLLAAATAKAQPDSAWLGTASAFPGKSRIEVIAAVVQNSCTDELSGSSPGARLTGTFQHDTAGDGDPYDIEFTADNTEVWAGQMGLAEISRTASLSSEAAAAQQDALDVRAGVLGLYQSGRFKTYSSQTGHTSLTGDAAFVSDFRFHLWPFLHGMLYTSELSTYAVGVLADIIANVPGLETESLDTFPLSEAYYAGGLLGDASLITTLQSRVLSRIPSTAPLHDLAIAAASYNMGGLATMEESADTVSGAGLETINGTASATEANDTATASGLLTITGSASPTEANDTTAADGLAGIRGAASVTEADDTATASGAETITGSANPTEENDTASASGLETIAGTAGLTEANDTATAEGTHAVGDEITGAFEATEAADTISGEGLAGIRGSAAPTEDADTASGSGTETISGSLTATEANDTTTAEGLAGIRGSATATEDNDTASGSGLLTVTGSLTATEANDTIAGEGSAGIRGAASATEDNDTITATGTGAVTVSGTATLTEENDTVTGTSLALVASGLNVVRVRAEDRTVAVANDSRTVTVATEERVVRVAA